jgi:hypothetical protein
VPYRLSDGRNDCKEPFCEMCNLFRLKKHNFCYCLDDQQNKTKKRQEKQKEKKRKHNCFLEEAHCNISSFQICHKASADFSTSLCSFSSLFTFILRALHKDGFAQCGLQIMIGSAANYRLGT